MTAPRGGRGFWGRLGRSALIVLAAVVSLLLLLLLLLQFHPVSTRLGNQVLGRITLPSGASIGVGEIRGNWLTRLELRRVRVVRAGTTLVGADTVRVVLHSQKLIAGRVVVRRLEILGPQVSAEVVMGASDETPPGKSEAPPLRPVDLLSGRFYQGRGVRVEELVIQGGGFAFPPQAGGDSPRLRDVSLAAHDLILGNGFAFELDSLALRYVPSDGAGDAFDLRLGASLSGDRLRVDGLRLTGPASAVSGRGLLTFDAGDSIREMEIELHTTPLSLDDLARLIPGLDLDGSVAGDVTLRGPRVDRLSGDVRLDCASVRVGEFTFDRSSLTAVLVDGRADLELATTCEEARASVRGWVRPLDAIPVYDAVVELDRLPRRLPAVPWWEDFARRGPLVARLRVAGSGYAAPMLNVDGELSAGGGRVTLAGDLDLRRELEWELRQLTIENVDVARWAGDTTASAVSGTFTAHGRGAVPESLHVAAAWNLAPSHYRALEIQSAEGRATLDGLQLGVSLKLTGESGSVRVDTMTVGLADGGEFAIPVLRFQDLDLARLSGIPELRGEFNGTLRLDGAGILPSEGEAGGAFADRFTADGLVVLERSMLLDRTIEEMTAAITLRDGKLGLESTMASDAGRIAVSAEARPFDKRAVYLLREARFTDLDLGKWMAMSTPIRLNGRITGTVTPLAPAEGRSEGPGVRWPPLSGSATLSLDSSRVGPISFIGGEATASMSTERLDARGSLRTTAGEARFEAGATPGITGPDGRARIDLPFAVLASLARLDTVKTEGGVRVDAAILGAGSETESIAAGLNGSGTVGDLRVDSLRATLGFDDGAVEIDRLALRSNAITVDAAGRVVLADSARGADSDFHLEMSVTDPAPLRGLLGADTLDVTDCRVEARLTGRPPAQSFSLNGSLHSLAWDGLRLLDGRIEARGELGRDWIPSRATGTVELGRLVDGSLRLDEAKVRASLDGNAMDFDLEARSEKGRIARLAGTGARDSSAFRLRLTELGVTADTIRWKLSQPAEVRYGKGRLTVDSLEVRTRTAFLIADGVLDRGSDQDFQLELRNVGLDIPGELFGRPDLGGVLDGRLAIHGPATGPRVEGDLRVRATSAGAPAGVVEARLRWEGDRAQAHASFRSPEGDSLVATADLPLTLSLAPTDSGRTSPWVRGTDQNVDLRLAARDFPLKSLQRLLPPTSISGLEGTLNADLQFSGPSGDMRGEGHVGIADGNVGLPSMGVVYRNVQVDGTFSGDRMLLKRMECESGKGRLSMTGEVLVKSATKIMPDLTLKCSDFLFIDTPQMRVPASGELRLSGSLADPEVRGKLSATGCSYTLTKADMAGSQTATATKLTAADVRMMEETFGYQAKSASAPLLGLFDAMELNLDVSLGRDNWVRNRNLPRLAVEVKGDIRARKQPHGEIDLVGRVAPVPGRSSIEQFGRTFDFTGGEILLNGPMASHTIDIRAEYKVREPGSSTEPEVLVLLGVRGDVEKVQLTLTSEPPLSETEIISYILTGQSPIKPPADASKSGSDAAALAADIGLSQVSGALEGAVQGKVGLDVLQVRYEATRGATLVAGRYLKPVLYVGLQQPLQYEDKGEGSSQNPYQTVVEVEYEALGWLVLNLQTEATLLRTFLRASHAY